MARPTEHGYRYHPLYGRWCDIKKRCYNDNCVAYKNYGGRGITMCDEWKDDAAAFVKWGIANGFIKGLTIDRIDNDGPYSPHNCHFVTRAQNNRNRRESRQRPQSPARRKKTGLPVGVHRSGEKFYVLASFKNKYKYFGTYETVQEAMAAYESAVEGR